MKANQQKMTTSSLPEDRIPVIVGIGEIVDRPKDIADVSSVLQRVARDIRNMYTLGYVPPSTLSSRKEELRGVTVDAVLPTGQKVKVRTRRAYLAGETQTNSETSFDAP